MYSGGTKCCACCLLPGTWYILVQHICTGVHLYVHTTAQHCCRSFKSVTTTDPFKCFVSDGAEPTQQQNQNQQQHNSSESSRVGGSLEVAAVVRDKLQPVSFGACSRPRLKGRTTPYILYTGLHSRKASKYDPVILSLTLRQRSGAAVE